MNDEIAFLNNQCDILNAEKMKLRYSDEYMIGKKMCQYFPVFRFIYHIFYQIMKKDKYNKSSDISSIFFQQEYLSWHPKVAVYKAVIGGYDNITPAPRLCPDVYDFFLFTDSDKEYKNWKKLEIPQHIQKLSNPILMNRFLKMHPHLLFPEYDYAVYVDGNIQVVSDIRPMLRCISTKTGLALHKHSAQDCLYREIKNCIRLGKGKREALIKQKKVYRKSGFPEHFGIFECGVIVVDIKNTTGRDIMYSWWKEVVEVETMRDQPALSYVLWKMGFTTDDIGNFGMNLFRNPKLLYSEHI